MARWLSGRGVYEDDMGVYIDLRYDAGRRGFTFLAGDYYTNTRNGNVFLCQQATKIPRTGTWHRLAKWKYIRTDVIMAPWTKVTGLSITRKGNAYTVSWKVPSNATDKRRNDRPNRIWYCLEIYRPNGKLLRTLHYNSKVSLGTTKHTVSLTRSQYYPLDLDRPAGFLLATVALANDYGLRDKVTARYNFNAPRAPTIGAITQDANTGVLSAKIDTNKGEDQYERYDTVYQWTTQNSTQKNPVTSNPATSTSASFTMSKDIAERQGITYGNYIRATFKAYARGMRGNSGTASRTYVLSYPNMPSIGVPKLTREPSSGRAVFAISTNVDKAGNFPVTGVRLQKLVSVEYSKATDIPANANWQNVGPQDNGSCTAMSVALEDLLPSAGTKTWVRVKTWNAIENIFYRYSDPRRLNSLETPAPATPSAADDYATIISCKAGDDGTSAHLIIGWDPTTGTDDSNWTEVSWSTNERAWRSSEQPKTFTFADQSWAEESSIYDRGVTYRKWTHFYIADLEPGQKYFIAVRRMMKPENGDATYGPYSTKVTITPSDLTEAPESVTLSGEGSVIRGEAIPLSWAYNGTAVQQAWSVKKMVGNSKSASDITLASGNDDRKFFNLPYYRNEARTSTISASTASSISLYVECRIANVYVDSEPFKVMFLDRPSFEVDMQDTLITQPALVSVFTDNPRSTVSVVVESNGIVSNDPERDTSQSDGDTIWSGTLNPSWQVVSSIASQSAVQQAKDTLDSAQEAYDEVMGQYEEARGRYDSATSSIEILEPKISDETRDLADAETELVGYQARLDGMDVDDPSYEAAVADVQAATQKVTELEDALAEDTQDLADAEAAQSQAEDDMDAIDYSDEQAALESAISAYATAVANAISPMDIGEVTHRAVLQLPEELQLLDSATYTVRAFATDPSTNVSSLEGTTDFTVSWSHQAPIPSPDISVTPFNERDEDDRRTIGARIELPSPTRALSTDVYDLYRVSRDGAHLALRGVQPNSTVVDEFATFASMQNKYIVSCRTEDGDIDWLEYPYFLSPSENPLYSMVRIDWNGTYVELEHNVSPSDAFAKDFVSHKHLDGTVSGHWNKGVMRTLRISAAIVRGYEAEQERLLRELARYDGPCLVRTTDGVFLEGNVSVDDIAFGSRTVKGDVSLTVTEITPTGTFAPTIEDEEEDETVEEEEEETTEEESDGGLL